MNTKIIAPYFLPNFENEWDQAQKYFEFKQMGKNNWLNFAKKQGKRIKLSEISEYIQNANMEEECEGGCRDMPIIVKFGNDNYEIIGGENRVCRLQGSLDEICGWQTDLSNNMFCI